MGFKLLTGNAQVPGVQKKIVWWLDRADFYDSRWFPGIKYFNSFEDLLDLSKRELDMDEHRLHLDWGCSLF
jgi:hypothetical protein